MVRQEFCATLGVSATDAPSLSIKRVCVNEKLLNNLDIIAAAVCMVVCKRPLRSVNGLSCKAHEGRGEVRIRPHT